MDDWAPRWTAWERDNVGLQVGRAGQPVRRVLVTLDVTDAVVDEAIGRRADLIVSHHPLIFRPLSSVSDADPVSRLILRLAERRMALFAAHTNLDAARDGVSFALARRLGLTDLKFLAPLRDTLAKIVVFVPAAHLERVRDAMAAEGAGVIGAYDSCAFSSPGTGSFRPGPGAAPFIGESGRLELAEEYRLEMICPRALVDRVLRAMRLVHPYEEVAADVYDVQNRDPNAGMGVIGTLDRAESLTAFARRVKARLGSHALRMAGTGTRRVRRVAVCGGSGSELIADAARAGADVFVTADVRYHAWHHLPPGLTLMDAGHWETEQVIVPVIAQRLQAMARQRRAALSVFRTELITNPVRSL